MMNIDVEGAKAAAHRLRADLNAQSISITHSAALELVAHQLGHRDWNTASAALAGGPDARARSGVGFGPPVPVVRVHRFEDVRAFYLDYLGFAVEWEHRFEPGMPLYARVTRDDTRLDLSEHHGDGTPGTVVWIPLADVRSLHTELQTKNYQSLRPGLDLDAPGGPTIEVVDPSGNTLRLCGTP